MVLLHWEFIYYSLGGDLGFGWRVLSLWDCICFCVLLIVLYCIVLYCYCLLWIFYVFGRETMSRDVEEFLSQSF